MRKIYVNLQYAPYITVTMYGEVSCDVFVHAE